MKIDTKSEFDEKRIEISLQETLLEKPYKDNDVVKELQYCCNFYKRDKERRVKYLPIALTLGSNPTFKNIFRNPETISRNRIIALEQIVAKLESENVSYDTAVCYWEFTTYKDV